VAQPRPKQPGKAAGARESRDKGRSDPQQRARSWRRRLREAPARLIGRTPWLRRWYARFMLKSIAKRRRKGKALPDELLNLERRLRGMAPGQQAKVLEQALEQGAAPPEASNRAARRAAQRPNRHSGRGQGHRPGMPPGAPRPRPPR
jgi:hypothetical protein